MKSKVLLLCAVAMTLLLACDKMGGREGSSGEAQIAEMGLTEANQQRLSKAVPAPSMSDSVERRNLVRRLETFNKADKISYIYLVSYGHVMANYTVKGKVSSVNSLLTTPEQMLTVYGHQSVATVTVPSPDLDGSYGTNGDAIFFFTTEGAYVEWRGEYMLADQPLKLSAPPTMVMAVE